MQYRTLGKTGLRVSVVGLGTMVHAGHFGPMRDEDSLQAIDAALSLGVNFIDTSDAYGAGYSETLLGHVRVGMPVRVRVDTWPDVWFRGHVATVASQGEYTPRNVQTRAQRAEQVYGVKVFVDPDPRLKAGMATEVDLGVKGIAQ